MALPSLAAIDTHQFQSEAQRKRFKTFVEELRCPKCQNQNLAGSNSQIATDLRRELYRLLNEGKTDSEIKAFMVDRYGDFVLYRPPLKSSTAFLWFFPLGMVFVGMLIVFLVIRQRRKHSSKATPLTKSEQEALAKLVKTNSEKLK